jgi:hypothetical protein
MVEIKLDFYKQEEEDIEEKIEEIPLSSILDLSTIIPGEIEIEDEIRMGYLRMKYKRSSR